MHLATFNCKFAQRGSHVSRAPARLQPLRAMSVEVPSTLAGIATKEELENLKDKKRAIYLNRRKTAEEKKLAIIAIGLTIHNAPVELREKLATPQEEWPRAIEELTG